MTARIHRLKLHPTSAEREAGKGLCGRSGAASEFADDVTCKRCQVEMRAFVRILAPETAAELLPPAPEEPRPLLEVRGTAELDERLERIVRRSIGGDDETQRRWSWPSAVVALASLVAFRVDGQPLRSTSAPSRFVRESLGEVAPDRAATAFADRIVGVAAALDRAYAAPRSWPESIDEDGTPRPAVALSVEVQRALLLRSVAGARGFSGQAHAQVGEWLEREHGVDLTERQIAIVRAEGLRAIAAHLRAIGELEPGDPREEWTGAQALWAARREEAKMGLPGCDLNGWKEISAAVGLSEDVCRRLSKRADDPLPVHRMRDVAGVAAKRAELREWGERQVRRAS